MLAVDPSVLARFVIAILAIVMSPGPDTLLILRYTLASGQKAGLAAVAGVQIGLVAHTALAVLGVSLVIASSPVLFKAVAILGALYLGWLGVQGLRAEGALRLEATPAPARLAKAVRDAVFTNLSNPKVILLFLALFPNFVDVGRGDVTAQLLTLAATLIAVNLVWQAPMAWAAEALRRRLLSPAFAAALARGTGAVLVVFALLMIWEQLF